MNRTCFVLWNTPMTPFLIIWIEQWKFYFRWKSTNTHAVTLGSFRFLWITISEKPSWISSCHVHPGKKSTEMNWFLKKIRENFPCHTLINLETKHGMGCAWIGGLCSGRLSSETLCPVVIINPFSKVPQGNKRFSLTPTHTSYSNKCLYFFLFLLLEISVELERKVCPALLEKRCKH